MRAKISRFSRTISLLFSVCILYGGLSVCTQAAVVYKVIDLGSFEGCYSEIHSINNTGQIVGGAAKTDGFIHATLFDSTGAGNNIDLGTLGDLGGIANAINDSGQIVGESSSDPGTIRATLFDATGAGENIDLGTLEGYYSFAYSINNSGQIVGLSQNRHGHYSATLFDPTGAGNNIDLGALGGYRSEALAINDAGQIIGCSHNAQGWNHATLFDPTGQGNNIDLGTLGGFTSVALSINNIGQIVGYSYDKQRSINATLFDSTGGGNNINLSSSDSFASEASAINDAGQIVGSSQIDSIFSFHATLFDPTGDGNNIDLNTLIDPNSGWTLTHANDINNNGWIVGNGINPEGILRAFLLVPISTKYSGGSGTSDDPYQIATAEDLITLGESPEDYDKHFILTDDIDLDPNLPGRKVFDKAVISPDTNPNDGFHGTPFNGVFDGNGHTISKIMIEGDSYLGLFGQLESKAEISNLGLEAVDVNGTGSYVGGLVGRNGFEGWYWYDEGGIMTNCYTTGAVNGWWCVGGIVGLNDGSITMSHSNVSVSGEYSVGGLVGWNEGSITASYSIGAVIGIEDVGGLVGTNNIVTHVTTSYSNDTVTGNNNVGGLVGYNFGSVTRCYSTSKVIGGRNVGGLVGEAAADNPDSAPSFSSLISRCYSSGSVTGNHNVGGLVGEQFWDVSIEFSFWDIENSSLTNMCGCVVTDEPWNEGYGDSYGKATTEMQTSNTFLDAGWDFVDETANGTEDIWWILEGQDYPRLYWE